ncbi:hypothetical protein GCM10022276_19830 [Sphingomonas limnosediminicola]|uniref:Uncharacterized protein n=1 Tax=Sphingomonas limnosediminicola TaxID=940133 RepID=A0ABP7LK52_9SPHN
MTDTPFPDHGKAALALLNGHHPLSRKAGQFLGQLAVDPTPISDPQSNWLAKLLERAGLPALAKGGGQ